MKTIPTPQHPDVTYWSCPEGDADVTIRGETFPPVLVALGQIAETTDLGDIMPASLLEQAEALVEVHEAKHLTGGACVRGAK